VSGLSSATSPASPSWSSSTSASSSALASPTFQQDPSRRLVSISPPLEPADEIPVHAALGVVRSGGSDRQEDVLGTTATAATSMYSAAGGQQQKNQRGKMTINTKLRGHSAGRSL
jgi:hypothetical protein